MESINRMKMRAYKIRKKYKEFLAFTIITVASSAFATTARGQTFAEWFRQKNTQKKYLLQQIAAFQVYAAYYNAGNNIAHNGLGSITSYLKSENGLHTSYYNNLNNASRLVKNNKQVVDILKWQNDILTRMNSLAKGANLNNTEKKYITQVKAALLKDCDQQITELKNLVTDSKLKMSDEERLRHIELIHSAIQDNYSFSATFSEQIKVYALQRDQEDKNLLVEKKIFGIK